VDAQETIERIATRLRVRSPERAAASAYDVQAAVCMMLRASDARLEFLAIKRSETEGDPWSGHMALPGGRRDAEDDSLWMTAVRETREEVGVDLLQAGRLLGQLDDVAPQSVRIPAIAITPFVVAVGPDVEAGTSPEVERAVWLPVDVLLEERHRGRLKLEFVPEREFPTIEYDGDVIWGLTLRILAQFEDLLKAIGYRGGARK